MPTLPDLPANPPLEVLKQGRVWLVGAYRRETESGETFSTHDSQIDAVRAAKTKMEEGRHPCTLRWDSPRSVGNLYWNPLFERLVVRYDELLDAWTVVPEEGTCAMAVCESRGEACERAKRIQHEYDFKHLRAFDAGSGEFEERDHRFLRHNITSAGVRFDPSAIDRSGPADGEPESQDSPAADGADEQYVSPATPGQLGASVPDVTKVQFVDTDGSLHRYATPWGDGTSAEILAVSRKHADGAGVRDAFETWLSRWRGADDRPTVATIYESGTDPVPWVAHQAGDETLASTGTDLPVETRVSAIDGISDAVDAMTAASSVPVCGVHPERVHLHTSGSDERVTVGQWGIEWAVQRSVGTIQPTPYTAPEQLDGTLTATTIVYQVGAVAYWLVCESPPVSGEGDPTAAIRAGTVPPARPVDPLPEEAGRIVERALETDPDDRYDSVEAFRRALRHVV
jgi:hypothetical protein